MSNRVLIDIDLNNQDALRGVREIAQAMGGIDQQTQRSKTVLDQFFAFSGAQFAINQLGKMTDRLVQMATASVEAAGAWELQEGNLAILLGSAEKASQVFADMRELTAKTPLQMDAVYPIIEQLSAAGVETDDLIDRTRRLGDLSRGNAENLALVADAYSKIGTIGKASLEQTHRFAERGIPIYDQLAKQIGVSKAQVFELISAGEIGFDDIETAIIAMTDAGGQFAGMMERASDTLPGRVSTMNDAFLQLGGTVAESLTPFLKEAAAWAAEAANATIDYLERRRDRGDMVAYNNRLNESLATQLEAAKQYEDLTGTLANLTPALYDAAHEFGAFDEAVRRAREIDQLNEDIGRLQRRMQDARGPIGDIRDEIAALYDRDLVAGQGAMAFTEADRQADIVRQLTRGVDGQPMMDPADARRAVSAGPDAVFEYLDNYLTDGTELAGELAELQERLRSALDPTGLERAETPAPEDVSRSWQSWFAEITGVAEREFGQSGAAGAQRFAEAIQSQDALRVALGEALDPVAALEEQQERIRNAIEAMLSIDPEDIDNPFSLDDKSVQELIARYREITAEIQKLSASPPLLDQMVTSEIDRIEEMTRAEDALAQARQARFSAEASGNEQLVEIYDRIIEQLRGQLGLTNELSGGWGRVAEWMGLSADEADILKNTADQLANIGLGALSDSVGKVGQAFADGAVSSREWKDILVEQGQAILQQLPMLFIQAGLQMIVAQNYPMGMALLAMGLTSSFTSGFVQGQIDQANEVEASAKGNVFSARGMEAFATGAAFSNSIVRRPTMFSMTDGRLGIMGEDGEEAVMPLQRDSRGRLGVRAAASYIPVPIAVPASTRPVEPPQTIINNYTGQPVTEERRQTASGRWQMVYTVGQMADKAAADGVMDRSQTRFGNRPVPVR